MWSSPIFWMVLAIVLFWALGAYNRVVRLRSVAMEAFGVLDAHMVRLVALLSEFGASQLLSDRVYGHPEAESEQTLAALQGATNQLSACLAVARARPLRAEALATLSAAHDVVKDAWAGAERARAPALPTDVAALTAGDGASADLGGAEAGAPQSGPDAGSPSPAPRRRVGEDSPSRWSVLWAECAVQNEQAAVLFNGAVAQYNEAIAQFPASVLAWVFGFKSARGL